MKKFLIMLPILALPVSAEVPRKPEVNEYSLLWNRSIFTSKPAEPERAPEVSAFADWALGGVSEVGGGHMVTLFNIKKQGESMVIRPDSSVIIYRGDTMEQLKPGAPGAFSVSKIERGKNSWKDTVVTLASGGRTGPVKFDDKQLQPKAAAAPPPQQQGRSGQLPPGVLPGQQGQQQPQAGGRQPRPRTVPPPQQGQQQQQQQQRR